MAELYLRTNHLDRIESGDLQAIWSANGSRILRYQIELKHRDLDVYKVVSAPEILILQNKVDGLLASWDRKYEAYKAKNAHLSEAAAADELTAEATDKLHSLETILSDGLARPTAIDWESMKDRSKFAKPFRTLTQPVFHENPQGPAYSAPEISLWDKISGKKAKKVADAEKHFQDQQELWQQDEKLRYKNYQDRLDEWRERTRTDIAAYKAEEEKFYAEQSEANARIDNLRQAVEAGQEEAVTDAMVTALVILSPRWRSAGVKDPPSERGAAFTSFRQITPPLTGRCQ